LSTAPRKVPETPGNAARDPVVGQFFDDLKGRGGYGRGRNTNEFSMVMTDDEVDYGDY
jgi:hypothetical protein